MDTTILQNASCFETPLDPAEVATEPSAKRRRATEQPLFAQMPLRWDDEFWLEEMEEFTPERALARTPPSSS